MTSETVIADIPKNRKEVVRVSTEQLATQHLIHLRVWFHPSVWGDLRPSREGLSLSVAKLPELIRALQQVETEARERRQS
jgi:hypothetical protein